MKKQSLMVLVSIALITIGAYAQDDASRAREMKLHGDSLGARALLQRAAQSGNPSSLAAYAEFLDLQRDSEARAAYQKLIAALPPGEKRAAALRRLLILDLVAGDHASAARHAADYRDAGGGQIAVPPVAAVEQQPLPTISLPGPLRSFSRMAALSPDLRPAELLPALARNVVTSGYQASGGNEALDQTEYLKLVFRYLSQARELEKLSGSDRKLRVPNCDSQEAGELLRVLGYRMRGGCGSDVVVETVNATRAFLTIDSGFPLSELEQCLRANKPFEMDYRPTQIPVMLGADYWRSTKEKEKQGQEFIDMFMSDPSLCRLYLGMAKLEPSTAEQLRKQIPAQRIRAFAHVLDFFGSMFQMQDGRAVVPGGARSEKAWADLAGASPEHGAAFFEKLLVRDDGWLASFYDALMRTRGPVHDYLTEPNRLKRFYAGVRGKITSPGPARPVFRSNTDMMLLTTRLRVGPDKKPVVPGNLDIWKRLFAEHPNGKYDAKLAKAAMAWKDPDDLVEALFALCRKSVENEPLKIFMALTDLDRRRSTPLKPETVDRLARSYKQMGAQYSILNEVPSLKDETIVQFLDTAKEINSIRDSGLRADSAGMVQALTGLWQILCRQESISTAEADSVLAAVLAPFGKERNYRELYDAGASGARQLLKAAGIKPETSPQDAMIDLLAGVERSQDVDSHTLVVQDMMRIFEAQRLVSLKTIFDLQEHLEGVSRGEKLNSALVNKLAARINDIQLPRASLSAQEKNSFAFGYWTDKHIDSQRKLNLRAAVEKAAGDPEKLKDVRGLLAPVLRDTLVGFNYVHYAPPGAQILLTNPLFVRGHDFLGMQSTNQTWKQTEVSSGGWPSSAGGRLLGSLAGLPYALAEAEQNFLVPRREQALIWGDLVPQMILMAKVPRWWNVTPAQMYWVALHLRFAESALAEGVIDREVRNQVIAALADHAPPLRVSVVQKALEQGNVAEALESITPSESYIVARDLATRGWKGSGPIASEIARLTESVPDQVSPAAISRAFGTPKPTLANSYRPELLNLRTFPTLMGYSSRMMAESWESNLLFYAALADEIHAQPSQLNILVPEWTQKTVEQIFATHLEDWPALLRSLRVVGDDVRVKSRKLVAANQGAN